jgi:hypothetical protein
LVLIEGARHFPHREQPVVFVRALEEFMESTAPSTYDVARFRGMLRRGGPSGGRTSPGDDAIPA